MVASLCHLGWSPTPLSRSRSGRRGCVGCASVAQSVSMALLRIRRSLVLLARFQSLITAAYNALRVSATDFLAAEGPEETVLSTVEIAVMCSEVCSVAESVPALIPSFPASFPRVGFVLENPVNALWPLLFASHPVARGFRLCTALYIKVGQCGN